MMRTKLHFCWALPLMAAMISCTTAEFKPRVASNIDVRPAGTQQLLADAKAQFRLGNFALAIDKFRRAVRQSPDDVDAYNGLAASYDRLGRFDLSRRYYEEALSLAPQDPKVRHNFAVSLRMQGLQEQALAFEAETRGPVATASAPVAIASVEPQAPAIPTHPVSKIQDAPFQSPVGSSVTIRLPPPSSPPVIASHAPVALRQSGLERLSLREVELVTKPVVKLAGSVRTRIQNAPRKPPVALLPAAKPVTNAQRTAPVKRQVSASQWEPLRVMNAVGRRGQATRMRGYLGGKGWDRVAVGDASSRRAKSVILYPAGAEGPARKLARQLPFKAPLLASRNATRIVLILGRNSAPFDDRLRSGGKKG